MVHGEDSVLIGFNHVDEAFSPEEVLRGVVRLGVDGLHEGVVEAREAAEDADEATLLGTSDERPEGSVPVEWRGRAVPA